MALCLTEGTGLSGYIHALEAVALPFPPILMTVLDLALSVHRSPQGFQCESVLLRHLAAPQGHPAEYPRRGGQAWHLSLHGEAYRHPADGNCPCTCLETLSPRLWHPLYWLPEGPPFPAPPRASYKRASVPRALMRPRGTSGKAPSSRVGHTVAIGLHLLFRSSVFLFSKTFAP